MRKTIILSLMVLASLQGMAQHAKEAKEILDKTAAVVGHREGASASFTISGGGGSIGTTHGYVAIKGNKFYARTPQATVWFNGKTQWTYMKSTNEVSVTTPNEAKLAQLNPYKFITLYKSGYTLGMKRAGNAYLIHMQAQNKQRSLQELFVTIGKDHTPSKVKIRQGQNWTTISISHFKTERLSDAIFSFRAKDFPKAEIVDLR